MINQYTLTQLTAAGTVTSGAPIEGILWGAYVANSAGTVTLATASSPATTFLTLTAGGTQWYYPRVQVHSTAGAALTTDGTRLNVDKLPINDYVRATFNGSGTVDVKLLVQQ